jgi:hypothetical protein
MTSKSTSGPTILLASDKLDFSKLSYGPKKATTPGGPENCRLLYDGKDFIIQGPRMVAPFGRSIPPDDYAKDGQVKHSFELSLDTSDKTVDKTQPEKEKLSRGQRVAEFRALLDKIEELNIKHISDNSKEWFGEHSTPDEVKKFKYGTMFKVSKDKVTKKKDGKYPDRLKVKLNVYKKNNKPDFKVYNPDKTEVQIAKEGPNGTYEIDWSWAPEKKLHEMVPIINGEGLWIISGKNVYMGWKMVAIRTFGNPNKALGADSFRDAEEDVVVTDPVDVAEPDEEEVEEEEEEVEEEEED